MYFEKIKALDLEPIVNISIWSNGTQSFIVLVNIKEVDLLFAGLKHHKDLEMNLWKKEEFNLLRKLNELSALYCAQN